MTENRKTPKLRFKGFTDAWEQRKLGEVATEMVAGGDVCKDLIVDKGRYPVIANALTNDGIIGYYNEDYRITAPAVTVTGRGDVGHAMARIVDFTPVVRLLSIKSNHNVFFLENAINTIKIVIESTGVPQLTVPQLAKYEIPLPKSLDEEEKIGIYFRNINNLITLHQRKLDRLKNIKKSMLDKMFPKDGEVVPEIRFKGFTDAWEQRKLDNITDVRDGTHDSPQYVETGHPFITSKNVKDGFINYEDIQHISDKDYEEINKRSKVDKNDILMGMIGTIGNIALVREKPNFAIKNVALIKDIGDVFYHYLYHCLQSNSVAHQLDENLDGGTQKFIALNKIRELIIPVPSEHEQRKIGDYMELLDNLITLHQRKLDKLKNIKKSMLDNMFV